MSDTIDSADVPIPLFIEPPGRQGFTLLEGSRRIAEPGGSDSEQRTRIQGFLRHGIVPRRARAGSGATAPVILAYEDLVACAVLSRMTDLGVQDRRVLGEVARGMLAWPAHVIRRADEHLAAAGLPPRPHLPSRSPAGAALIGTMAGQHWHMQADFFRGAKPGERAVRTMLYASEDEAPDDLWADDPSLPHPGELPLASVFIQLRPVLLRILGDMLTPSPSRAVQ